MNILATYSGEPYETFGKVPEVSKDRQWIGKGVGKKGDSKDDIRGYIDTDKNEDIIDLRDRLNTFQSVFDMITGSVRKCSDKAGEKCGTGGGKFIGCDGKSCLPCKEDASNDKEKLYVRTSGSGSVQFPGYYLKCANMDKVVSEIERKEPVPGEKQPDICKRYILFDSAIDKDKKKSKDPKKHKPISLHDVCPDKCKVCSS